MTSATLLRGGRLSLSGSLDYALSQASRQLEPPSADADPERAAARDHLLPFTTRTFPGFAVARHHALIADHLEAVERGEIRRLMVTMPPRHTKSELCSIRFPAWYLGRHPERQVIGASYAAELAYTFSRQARNLFNEPSWPFAARLASDSASVKHWSTDQGGEYLAAGVGGPATGHGAHLLVIDDPVKNFEQADSETYRDSVWNWYTSTARTRLMPDAAIILIQTRWHGDDLAGRLIERDTEGQWVKLNLPALAEDTDTLGRLAGEPLWPEWYDAAELAGIRADVGPRVWAALYQQRPAPREGAMFKRGWFKFVDAAPAIAKRVRWWDQAATHGGGDYTVGLLMAALAGEYFIEDVVRGQWDIKERDAMRLATAERDRQDYDGAVRQWIEEEGGSAGKEASRGAAISLAGYAVSTERPTGSKETRAEPLASQAAVGNVKIVRGKWNTAFLDELCEFPHGAHDDQVDTASGAFNKLALRRSIRPL